MRYTMEHPQRFTDISLLTITFALTALVALVAPATVAAASCDLQAEFSRGQTTLPGTYPAKLSLTYRNVGRAECPSIRVRLERHAGRSISRRPVAVGVQALSALSPGQKETLRWSDTDHPDNGSFTYAPSYPRTFSDADRRNHSPSQTITFKTQTTGGTSRGGTSGGGGKTSGGCDLEAEFSRGQTTLPGTYPAKLSLTYRNVGRAECPSIRVRLERHDGRSISRRPVAVAVGVQTLSALSPGQKKTLRWSDTDHPANGSFTYSPSYARTFSDADRRNHSPSQTITFKTQTTGGTSRGGTPGGAEAGCDLAVSWLEPSGSTVPPASTYEWKLRFRNVGSGTCGANNVKLSRYGSSCGGSGSAIGGSGGFEALAALSPNGSQDLTFTEGQTPGPSSSYYCYKFSFASPHNDANNQNHSPTAIFKKVRFQEGGVTPGPSPGGVTPAGCPTGANGLECSGNGTCLPTGNCDCKPDYSGSACETVCQRCYGAIGNNCGAADGFDNFGLCAGSKCLINAGSWEHDECCIKHRQNGPSSVQGSCSPPGSGAPPPYVCQTEFNKAVAHLAAPGLTWERTVNTSKAVCGTGELQVNHADMCNPSGGTLYCADKQYCCSGSAEPAGPPGLCVCD